MSPHSTWRISRARITAAFLGAIGLSLLAADPAHAADYLVVQCHNQHSNGAVFPSPFSSNGQRPKGDNKCPNDGGLGVYEDGGPAADGVWGQWAWSAPPTTYFTRIDYRENTRADTGWQPYFIRDPWPSGNPQPHQAKKENSWVSGYAVTGPTRAFHVFLECFGGCTNGGAHNYVKNLFFTVEDTGLPNLGLAGSAVAPGPRHGPESLTVLASDLGSGVRLATIAVNDVQVASQVFVCALSDSPTPLPYKLRPCPTSVSPALTMQTDAPPWRNGSNDLEVCVRDYAVNTPTCLTRSVQVDNSCPSSGGQPADDLDAGVEDRGATRPQVRVRSNQSVVARGTLRTVAGEAVDGATVCVFETAAIPDATPQLVARAQTKNGGRFAALLDRGPSRNLRFVYRYSNEQLEDQASIRSSVVPVFRVGRSTVRNGSTVRFRGRLPGPRASNRVVAIQVRLPKKWRTFKAPRTDEQGRFRAAYHFISSGTFRYSFRAVVKRQRGYPYEPGPSKKRRILVIG